MTRVFEDMKTLCRKFYPQELEKVETRFTNHLRKEIWGGGTGEGGIEEELELELDSEGD